MGEETTLQSMFTNYALQTLFPDWEAHPEHARRISMAHLGLHLDPAEALSPEDTEVKDVVKVSDEPGAAPLNITDIGVSVSSADDTTAKVTVVVEIPDDTADPRGVLRGKTVREIGLFVNTGTDAESDWKMVWLSDLPAMYVPTTAETGIAVSFTITVPIRFDNVSQISLITDNDSLAARIGRLETEVGGLKTEVGGLEIEVDGLDNRLTDAESNITEVSNWKDTVQPQIMALVKRAGFKVSKGDKTTLNTYDYTFDPGVAAAMATAGGYYGGYELDAGDMERTGNGTHFFEVEVNADFAGIPVPYYGKAIVKVRDNNGTMSFGVQQLDAFGGSTSSSAAICVEDVQQHAFRLCFCCYSSESSIQASDVPDIQNFYGRIRELSGSLYDIYED